MTIEILESAKLKLIQYFESIENYKEWFSDVVIFHINNDLYLKVNIFNDEFLHKIPTNVDDLPILVEIIKK